ncbi:YesL family protein [Marinilactibacillus sp. Marseille-P9653]|uniref:YesL family protein n=1 Tax=Marinilactibacillus sp. Marseille-P9653 TaxID=2866583 RepID=UPI001CE4B37E|nr:DUF624 domain-containing protein [Marinilactibacillus sp. Marseille-P9653]
MAIEKNLPKQTSVIVRFTEWFANLSLLNMIWLLFCIPVVTIIPASESLFYVVNKLYKAKEKHPIKLFLSHFKENGWRNFKQDGYLVVIYVLFLFNFMIIRNRTDLPDWMYLFTVAISVLFVLAVLLSIYYLSLKTMIEMKPEKRWLLSFYLVFKYILSNLGLSLAIALLFGLLFLWPTLAIFFSMSLSALISIIVVERNFHKFNKQR